jgi:hypothetical protein
MLKIYGVPISVHTRKVILAARPKGLLYDLISALRPRAMVGAVSSAISKRCRAAAFRPATCCWWPTWPSCRT